MLHALILTLASAAPSEPPRLRAAFVEQAPRLDGKLDDPAWQQALPTEAFTQKFPNEATAPSERTTLRVVYDREAVYVGFDCEQREVPIIRRLTRRGRVVEADWVSLDIGSRADGKSAFEFMVNAAGVLSDGLRFNDTDYSPDWDENWDARTALTPTGWSAEIKIPLRILRYDEVPEQSWDLEARRYVSTRQETDEWAFIPRDAGGEVSHYGKLTGLVGLSRPTPIEVRPFAVGRVRHTDPSLVLAGSGTDFSASGGFDFKYHPSQALTVDATVNPDFAQVDPDQLVLNLTRFETYYPEQRPFFLEGLDVYSTPMQLLYTRRIGHVPGLPALRPELNEMLVDFPQPAPIYGAAKVTGRVADRWTIGVLEGVTAPTSTPVQLGDGSRVARILDPLSSYSVARVKRDFGENAEVGLTFTGVKRFEHPDADYPPTLPSGPDPYATALCPSGPLVEPGSRCFNDAYVAGVDWRWRSPAGTWVTGGQSAVSLLQAGPPRQELDGTTVRPGSLGTGTMAYLNKEGGKHWVGDAQVEFDSRRFDVNDLGYDRRGNMLSWGADLEWRDLDPWWRLLETHARFEYFDKTNLDGLDLGGGYQLNVSGKTSNFWDFFTELHYRTDHFDDREVGDGTALERAALIGHELELTSNKTQPVSFTVFTQTQFLTDGFNFYSQGGVTFRLHPQLDLELLPYVRYTFGEPRYMGPGVAAGEYLFGKLNAAGVGTTVRATFTFTPRLTLQAYAQVFLASEHFTDFTFVQSDPAGPRPVVHLADLRSFSGPLPFNPDVQEGAVNVNVVLRWEFLLGSTAFLVYTHSQLPLAPLAAGEEASLSFGAVQRAPASDALLLKISFWFGA